MWRLYDRVKWKLTAQEEGEETETFSKDRRERIKTQK